MDEALKKRAWQVISLLPADDADIVRALIRAEAEETERRTARRYDGPRFGWAALGFIFLSCIIMAGSRIVGPVLFDAQLAQERACCDRAGASIDRLELFERACEGDNDLKWEKR